MMVHELHVLETKASRRFVVRTDRGTESEEGSIRSTVDGLTKLSIRALKDEVILACQPPTAE